MGRWEDMKKEEKENENGDDETAEKDSKKSSYQ